ncbi:MAG: hypothetical protein ACR2NZ_21305 [Rubripirellula sp.]
MSNDNRPDPLEAELRKLRPAAAKMDPQAVFYQAGYQAGLSARSQSPLRKVALRTFLPAIAASLLVALITVPASYQAGQLAATGSSSDERSPQHDLPDENRLDRQPSTTAIASEQRAEPIPESSEPRNTNRGVATPHTALTRPVATARLTESKSQLLARWLSPIEGMAESAKLDRQAQTTLTAGHSSLAAREDSAWNWVNFPFAVTSESYHRTTDASNGDIKSPLAATDMQEIAITLEALR